MTRAAAQARPANWQPVLVGLIHQNRKIFAVKLLALAFRYETAEGRPDLARAMKHTEAIWSHNRPLPDGTEHPDLSEAELSYYRDGSWRERKPTLPQILSDNR
jgi:hypothetical protein